MSVTINGKTYDGNSVTIINNRIIIDGKEVNDGSDDKSDIRNVIIKGDIKELNSDVSVTVEGNVTGNVRAGSSVSCDDVGGDVSAGSSVSCDDVGGNVSAGSSISCDNIQGSAKAGSRIIQ